jgi:hypothetical protein
MITHPQLDGISCIKCFDWFLDEARVHRKCSSYIYREIGFGYMDMTVGSSWIP